MAKRDISFFAMDDSLSTNRIIKDNQEATNSKIVYTFLLLILVYIILKKLIQSLF